MAQNAFDTLSEFTLSSGRKGRFYSLPALEAAGVAKVSRLPVSIRLVLESLLRNCDGKRVADGAIRDLASWQAKASRTGSVMLYWAALFSSQNSARWPALTVSALPGPSYTARPLNTVTWLASSPRSKR